MKSSNTFGELIREARNQKQLSQADLSAAMGYPYNIVFKLEDAHCEYRPTPTQWKRLSELLEGALDLEAAEPLLKNGLAEDKPDEHLIGVKPIAAKVGHRLRELRGLLGYTFNYAAEQLGTNTVRLLQLESGHVEASYTELHQVTKLYGTSYEYVLDGIERA